MSTPSQDDREIVISDEERRVAPLSEEVVAIDRVVSEPVPLPAVESGIPDVAPVTEVDGRRVTETERVDVLPDGSVERRLDRVEDGVVRRGGPFDPVWPAVLILLALVVAGALAAWYFTRDTRDTVPTVIGMQVDDAVTRLQDDGFKTSIQRAQHGEPVGQVYGQDPAAAAESDEGATVTLLVSSGDVTSGRLPNAVGLTEVEARDRMAKAGVPVTVQRVFADQPSGTVTKQDPAAGTDVGTATTVALTVSKGANTTGALAAVTGLALDDAVNRLQADGYKTQIKRLAHAEPVDQVYGQQPPAGSTVARGKTVTLLVSSGPAEIAVPNAVGLQEAAARDRLAQAGLQVTVVQAFSEDQAAGTVIAQAPTAGGKIAKDGRVTLTVSKGAASATVPNVVGEDVSTAQAAVTDAGFMPNVNRVPSAEPEGTVVAQHPVGGTARKGSFVRLNVSTGTPQ